MRRGEWPGVTVITATNKPRFMDQLLRNYRRQKWPVKELIVILNHDKMDIEAYRKAAGHADDISVYRLPATSPLGACLNAGIRKAKHEYIAKFDDDDYYGAEYLTEALEVFREKGADIVGKRRFYMYFKGSGRLCLAKMPRKNSVAGATIMFRKRLFPKVRFSRLRAGSDMRFLQECRKLGYKIESSSKYHFTAIRRASQKGHTWKVTRRTMRLLRIRTVARMSSFPPDDDDFLS